MSDYANKRSRLLEYLVSLVRDPLALFIIRANGWAPDFLVAAVEHPQAPSVYLVLGISDRFPCWDESIVKVPDWDALLRQMETWLAPMQARSGSVQFPKLPTQPTVNDRPEFKMGDDQPIWFRWLPASFGFSFPTRNPNGFAAHDPPTPLAPPKLVTWYVRQETKLETLRGLREFEKKEKEWLGDVETAREGLEGIQRKIAAQREVLTALERQDQPA